MSSWVILCAAAFAGGLATPALAQRQEYLITPSDILKVTVFKNPDLSLEVRVSEGGTIDFPLIGSVHVSDLTLRDAERRIGKMLENGRFIANPQVNILVTQAVGSQVSVLGQVNHPGRYAIETGGGHLSGMLALAGGISPNGADVVIVAGSRNGSAFRREIDVVRMSLSGNTADDIAVAGGDMVFVNRAPMFYIYGEVQRPGQFRLERNMTVMQALASGGGVTGKGTRRGIVVHRRDTHGTVTEESVKLDDDVKDEDVIYVHQSLF